MFTVAAGQLNLREERLLAASLVPGGPEEGALPAEPFSASRSALVLYNVQFVCQGRTVTGQGISTSYKHTRAGNNHRKTCNNPYRTVSGTVLLLSSLFSSSQPPEATTCLQGGEGHEEVLPGSSS